MYARDLPGGGFVAIEVRPSTSWRRARRYQGMLIVERRSQDRFDGGAPPIIARATERSVEGVVRQLLPTAQCNPAIGAAMLARERAVAASG